MRNNNICLYILKNFVSSYNDMNDMNIENIRKYILVEIIYMDEEISNEYLNKRGLIELDRFKYDKTRLIYKYKSSIEDIIEDLNEEVSSGNNE